MERVIFAELLDRRNRVHTRVRINTLPFRIGRSYNSDLILDDPHVESEHAVVEDDGAGGLRLRDLDSQNGCFEGGAKRPSAHIALGGDTLVRLGHSQLRFRDANFAHGAAIKLVAHTPFVNWLLEHWSALLLIPALGVLLKLGEVWRNTTGDFEWVPALSETTTTLIFLVVWVGAWSLVNQMMRGRARVVAHTVTAFGFEMLLSAITDVAMEWMRFLFAPIEPLELLKIFLLCASGSLMLLAHLSILGAGRRALRYGIALLVATGALGVMVLNYYSTEQADWVETLPYWSRLEPINPRWLTPEAADAYFHELDAMQPELDTLAEKALAEQKPGGATR